MKRILKIVGVIIFILLLIALVYFIRNFVIINSLAETYDTFFSSNNYAYITTVDNGAEVSTFKYYYKDGKNVEIWEREGKVVREIWYDINTQERVLCNLNELTANVGNTQDTAMIFTTDGIYSLLKDKSILEKMRISFMHFINTETINGEKCYVLKPLYGVTSNTYYFNKETKFAVKCHMSFGATKIDFKEWKLDEVTDEDVSKPDLTNYTVTYSK